MQPSFKQIFIGMLIVLSYSQSLRLLGQTQIAFQGFEGAANDNWSFTPVFQNPASPQVLVGQGNYGPGYAASGVNSLRIGGGSQTCGVGSANCINGAPSGGSCTNNQNGAEVEFSLVDVSCYQNIVLSIAYRTHVLCTSPTFQGQGLDAGDRLFFDISQNGGPYVTSATVNGFNNCTWNYFNPAACSGPPVANPFVFSFPPGTNQVAFRIRLQINRSDEVLYIDNVSLSGDLKSSDFVYPPVVCSQDGFVSPLLASDFDFDGSFTSTAGLVFDPDSGVIDAGNSIPGTYQVDYSFGGTICSSYILDILSTPTTTPIYHE